MNFPKGWRLRLQSVPPHLLNLQPTNSNAAPTNTIAPSVFQARSTFSSTKPEQTNRVINIPQLVAVTNRLPTRLRIFFTSFLPDINRFYPRGEKLILIQFTTSRVKIRIYR